PEWKFARGGIPSVDGLIVRIIADDGLEGHGYALALPLLSDTINGLVETVEAMRPHLVGRDPCDQEDMLRDLEKSFDGHRHVRSAIDAALFELGAAIFGVPLHRLFGGAVKRS